MQPETYYHIYNHANGDENLFRESENYRFFLEKWGKYVEPIADTYAYCLMPNPGLDWHLHFLVRIKEEEELLENLTGLEDLSGFLSQQYSNLLNSYTKAYNIRYNRRGSLFNRPFKAKQITSDTYLTNVIFYIHHDSVHHGFTKHIQDWPHSSYHAMVSDKLTRVRRRAVQDWFGNQEELKKSHSQAIQGLEKLENELT